MDGLISRIFSTGFAYALRQRAPTLPRSFWTQHRRAQRGPREVVLRQFSFGYSFHTISFCLLVPIDQVVECDPLYCLALGAEAGTVVGLSPDTIGVDDSTIDWVI